MHRSPAPIQTVRVGPSRPWPARTALVVAALVALTLLRPWGDGSPPVTATSRGEPGGPALSRPAAVAAVPATPTPSPSPRRSLAPDQIACPAGGTQLVSLDRMGSWTVRTWVPAHPVVADGPLDPAVEDVALESPAVLGVGVCLSPGVGDEAAVAAVVVRAWSFNGGRARAMAVQRVVSGPDEPGVAILYRPAAPSAAAVDGTPAWPPGRYALWLAAPLPETTAASTTPVGPVGWFIRIVVPGRP